MLASSGEIGMRNSPIRGRHLTRPPPHSMAPSVKVHMQLKTYQSACLVRLFCGLPEDSLANHITKDFECIQPAYCRSLSLKSDNLPMSAIIPRPSSFFSTLAPL